MTPTFRAITFLSSLLLAGGALLGCGDESGDGGVYSEGMMAGDCGDGADNDGDGAFDCNDTGCIGAPVCQSVMTGDGGTHSAPDTGSTPGGDSGSESSEIACGSGQFLLSPVMLSGAWEVPDDPDFQSGCDRLLGDGDILCMIDQAECSVDIDCRVVGSTTSFTVTDDVARSGPDYQMMGSTTQSGIVFDYTAEFTCPLSFGQPDACNRPDRVNITISSAIGTCMMEGLRL